ncbi:MAG: hypothetical protein HQ566_02885 [Candidatus Omnitrophica bacterium]|nr:hypothetical protein [Candidatus Omnitrophota bacterium]
MKTSDRLFIFVAAVLVFLFAFTVFQNTSKVYPPPRIKNVNLPKVPEPKAEIPEILTRLEEAGLEPREARYYE